MRAQVGRQQRQEGRRAQCYAGRSRDPQPTRYLAMSRMPVCKRRRPQDLLVLVRPRARPSWWSRCQSTWLWPAMQPRQMRSRLRRFLSSRSLSAVCCHRLSEMLLRCPNHPHALLADRSQGGASLCSPSTRHLLRWRLRQEAGLRQPYMRGRLSSRRVPTLLHPSRRALLLWQAHQDDALWRRCPTTQLR